MLFSMLIAEGKKKNIFYTSDLYKAEMFYLACDTLGPRPAMSGRALLHCMWGGDEGRDDNGGSGGGGH